MIRSAILGALVCALTACAMAVPRNAVPEQLYSDAVVPGMSPDIRFWGDAPAGQLENQVRDKVKQMRARFARSGRPRTLNYLALSGGGEDGAFGAGLLAGWTKHGTRPKFEIVTGVSTGSMIAPFAFLGPAWDEKLERAYTLTSIDDVSRPTVLAGLFGGASITDNKPLADMIASFADEEMLQAIAAEHRTGRRLLIGTTNLDAQRPVIWDIGKIANSGQSDALELFRKVLLASAGVPGVFPPTFFEVEAGAETYDEIHVDGGVTSQVFLFPTQVRPKRYDAQFGYRFKRRIFVIRNSKVTPEPEVVEAKLIKISSRSIFTIIKAQGIGDLIRIYAQAMRDGIDYNLAYIPPGFIGKAERPFDQAYMQELFKVGYELGRRGYRWNKQPPVLGSALRN